MKNEISKPKVEKSINWILIKDGSHQVIYEHKKTGLLVICNWFDNRFVNQIISPDPKCDLEVKA